MATEKQIAYLTDLIDRNDIRWASGTFGAALGQALLGEIKSHASSLMAAGLTASKASEMIDAYQRGPGGEWRAILKAVGITPAMALEIKARVAVSK